MSCAARGCPSAPATCSPTAPRWPARPDRPARPVLGRPDDDGHPARAHPGVRPGVPALLPRRRARRSPTPLKPFSVKSRAEAQAVLQVPATEPGGRSGDEERGSAGPGRLRRRGAAEQVVRGLYAGGAGGAAPNHQARSRLTPPRRRTRRTCPRRSGRAPDLRRTVRETMRTHGEPAELFWRRRRLRLRPLILILDVSGSMADYSRNLLQFAYSARARRRAGRGVLLRHPADPHHPGARAPPGRRRDGAGGRGRVRLGGRYPDRRVAGRLRPRLGAARRVPRRHRGDLLRRPGPRRPGRAGHRDGTAVPAVPPGGVDEPAQGRQRRTSGRTRSG